MQIGTKVTIKGTVTAVSGNVITVKPDLASDLQDPASDVAEFDVPSDVCAPDPASDTV